MALVVADRVQETTTTSGTGTINLAGAVAGFQSFVSGIGSGNTTYYTIYDQTAQVWEIGIGTVTSGSPDTLSRDTVLRNSSGGTAKINFAGNSSTVFCVYTAVKSVNLDASGNVTPLGTISSGTWQGTTIGVGYGGTGVTASSGANSVMLRDANQNVAVNRLNQSNTDTTAAGGTTALTAASSYSQTLIGTGGQTFTMPDATTLTTGVAFVFNNNATGTLTLQDYATGSIGTITSGGAAELVLLANGTVAGTWDVHGFLPEAVTWGTNSLNLGSTVITNGTWNGGTITSAYGGTGLTTFTGANNALYSTNASTLAAGTLPVAAGGTGVTTTPTNGQLLIGNGTNYTVASLGSGTGISTTTGSGSLTINNTGVTSLAGTSPVDASASTGSVTVSLASGYGDTQNPYASKTANYVLAAPNGSAGVPTFRALVAADIPSLSYVTSVGATSPVASSGGTTPTISLSSGYGDTQNPYASKTANYFLAAPNGVSGAPTFRAIVAADVPTLNQNTTGTAANITASSNTTLTSLSSLATVGTITSGTWSASFGAVSGANLTNLTAGNLSGTIPSGVLGNSTAYVGTTAFALNRASANQALTGITSISFPGSSSGTAILQATATAGTPTLSLPTTTGTLALTSDIPTVNNGTLTLGVSGTGLSGSATFTANQAGASTFTVTSNATSANTASTIVARDASGNFSAGTITATLSGNASTATSATSATTATNLAGGSAGTIPYQSAAGTTVQLAAGSSGQILQSNGAAAPSWVTNSAGFAAGTRMIFAQTSAPTGWTKDTTNYNNHALRVVTGAASTGGTVDFTTAFASQSVAGSISSTTATNQNTTAGGSISVTVGAGTLAVGIGTLANSSTTLTTSQIPSHSHGLNNRAANFGAPNDFIVTGNTDGGAITLTTKVEGGGGSHTHTLSGSPSISGSPSVTAQSFTGTAHSHTQDSHNHTFTGTAINLAVKYLDVITATKN